MRWAANLSILFTELPLVDRPAAAAAAGFDAVEFWWPFPTATPSPIEVDTFVDAVESAGVQLVALNFFAGDLPSGDRGLVSLPGREDEFQAGVRVAVGIAERLGTKAFNALYGNRLPATDPAEQDETALRNLRFAATETARIGATVLIEPVSGVPAYPLLTAADAIAVIDRVGADNVALLADLYHLSVNGDDVPTALDVYLGRIGHVQIADAPGRHEPGTGNLDLATWLHTLDDGGYTGYVAAEYKPSGTTVDSLDWMARP
ncbi:MAG TPA: TIM barrel protein [Pseudonocardiaceae bacterium]|nr:TIM barrel protein [Pseudonocardiaceae bacterium]